MCRTEFEQSPLMGTYQPTFIVHDMDYIEGKQTEKSLLGQLGIQTNMFEK